MRKLALAAFVLSVVTGGFLGCGGSTPRKVMTGTAGTGGTDASGTAGTVVGTAGVGGDMGGAGGAAGTDAGTAGAGGAAGMDAAAGATAGSGGETMDAAPVEVAPPPPAYCDTHPQGQLPYNIATGFKVIHILTNNTSAGYWKNIASPDCTDNPTYPPFPVADGGSDGAAEASADGPAEGGATDATGDAPDETATLALLDPDAGDGGVADAAADAPIDVAADGSAADGGTDVVASNDGGSEAGADAGPPLPACYEFSYDPDGCTGTACWAGVVFEVTDIQGPSADTKGVCIQRGAMGIEFMARASKNNANVKFGSIGEGVGNTEFYKLITTTWARYVITIPAQDQQSYDETAGDMQGVWNAFSIVVDNADYVGGAYIEVKDIHWIAAAQ